MQIQLDFYWPTKLTRTEKLEQKVLKYLNQYDEITYVEHLDYVLKMIRNKDFCVIQYGENKWDYLQFVKEDGRLILSFPWSITLGRRCKQRDLLEQLLLRRDFHRKTNWWLEEKNDRSLFYYDTMVDSMGPELIASFGMGKEELALGMTATIARDIFRLHAPIEYEIKLGSWR